MNGGSTTPPEAVRREFETIVDDWAAAIVSNEADRIGTFMAEDWVIFSDSGLSSKSDFLAFVRSGTLTHSAMDRVGDARFHRSISSPASATDRSPAKIARKASLSV